MESMSRRQKFPCAEMPCDVEDSSPLRPRSLEVVEAAYRVVADEGRHGCRAQPAHSTDFEQVAGRVAEAGPGNLRACGAAQPRKGDFQVNAGDLAVLWIHLIGESRKQIQEVNRGGPWKGSYEAQSGTDQGIQEIGFQFSALRSNVILEARSGLLMIKEVCLTRLHWFAGCFLLLASTVTFAGYKVRPWTLRERTGYPANLTSEKVTIAAEPLFDDALAAKVFDKNDIVTRGIMPLGIIVFNDNDFPVEIVGGSIEVIQGNDHYRTLPPGEVVHRLFQKGKAIDWNPLPFPRKQSMGGINRDALDDFDQKFLGNKVIAPHDKGGGFLYMHILASGDLPGYLSKARVYIPEIVRRDTGAALIYFEFDLKPAIVHIPRN
jgi:hypothetical protein